MDAQRLKVTVKHGGKTYVAEKINAGDLIAWEEEYDRSAQVMEVEMRAGWILFLAHHALVRGGAVLPPWAEFKGACEHIETEMLEPEGGESDDAGGENGAVPSPTRSPSSRSKPESRRNTSPKPATVG